MAANQAGGAGGPADAARARKPMYEDEHPGCSVLLAKIRNEQCLLSLPPHDQFRWLHRFYLVLDRIAEQHRVYKLYGGPHGFMISTGVAEQDRDHPATLLRFSLHLLQTVQAIRLPGQVPLDLVMVLASGPASSGLLGTTSLTYQIVGRSVSIARELMETQEQVPFLLTSGMFSELQPSVASELLCMGSVPLRCCPGQAESVYSLPRYGKLRLTLPPLTAEAAAAAAGPASAEQTAAGAAAAPSAEQAVAAAEAAAGVVTTAKAGEAAATAAAAAAAAAGVAGPPEGGAAAEAEAGVGEQEQEQEQAQAQAWGTQYGEMAGCERAGVPAVEGGVAAATAGGVGAAPGPTAASVAAAAAQQAGATVTAAAAAPSPVRQSLGSAAAPAAPVMSRPAADSSAERPPSPPKPPRQSRPEGGSSKQHQQEGIKQEGMSRSIGSLPRNTHKGTGAAAVYASDLLLRFEDPGLEDQFARFNGEAQQYGELAWMVLGLLTALLYCVASAVRGEALPVLRILHFQLLPLLGICLWHLRRDAFFRYREALWFVQRFMVLLATSIPTSFVFAQPAPSPLFAFGLCNLGLEMLTRRLRLHLQLLCSLLTYTATMILMSLHPEGSPGQALITPAFLSTHLLVTCVAPVAISAFCDNLARLAFKAHLAEQQQQQRQQQSRRAQAHQKQQQLLQPQHPSPSPSSPN